MSDYQITGIKPFRIAHGDLPNNIHVTLLAWDTENEATIYGRLAFGIAKPWCIVQIENGPAEDEKAYRALSQ